MTEYLQSHDKLQIFQKITKHIINQNSQLKEWKIFIIQLNHGF